MRSRFAAIAALAMTACAASRPVSKLSCAKPKTRIWPLAHGAAIQPAKQSIIQVPKRLLDASPEGGLNGTDKPNFHITYHQEWMGESISLGVEIPGRIERHPDGDATVTFELENVFRGSGWSPPLWADQSFGIDRANHDLAARWIRVEPDGSVGPGDDKPQRLDVEDVVERVGSSGWRRDVRIHYDDVLGFDVVVRTECSSGSAP